MTRHDVIEAQCTLYRRYTELLGHRCAVDKVVDFVNRVRRSMIIEGVTHHTLLERVPDPT